MRKRFGRPSPALAISLIALFVAMGGTSYGLARNSIDSREIRNNDVRTQDIRNNTVRSTDVRNGSLLSKDFKAGQLPAGPQGATGSGGPAGPRGLTGLTGQKGQTGQTGQKGNTGSPGLSNLNQATGTSASNSQSSKTVTATCQGGRKVIGMGANLIGEPAGAFPNETADVVVGDVFPVSDTQVFVRATEIDPTAKDWSVVAYAICATVAP